jgi:hypothetical protein
LRVCPAPHQKSVTEPVPGRSRGNGAPSVRFSAERLATLSYNRPVLTDDDKQWIREQLERVETTLLTEFHKWASPVELRQRSHAAALRALDAEVESLSDRLKNLEGH